MRTPLGPHRHTHTHARRRARILRASVAVAVGSALGPVLGGAADPARAGAAALECTQDWRPAREATYLNSAGEPTSPARPLPPPPTPEHRAFHVFCAGRYVNTVWLGPHVSGFEAVRVAREIVARAVYPSVRPAANPARGLTGLPSWFWATADPTPVLLRAGNGPRLDLELRVQTVRWRFGDGSPGTVAGLGLPYPTPSPIAHSFERTGTYTVDAQVVVAGRFWFEELTDDLPVGGHTVALRHDVAELRSLLHAR